jgi:uncharacterized protein (TIGR03118 family)
MQRLFTNSLYLVAIVALSVSVASQPAMAQYGVTTLVSNHPNTTKTFHSDPNLVNAWGMARSATSPFWVSDNGTGLSTLYNGQGVPQSLVVSIPSANPDTPSVPTGIVFNSTTHFAVQKVDGPSLAAIFLFATLNGTIAGWNPNIDLNHAQQAAASTNGAVYTGLAISDPSSAEQFLYATDVANGRVDVYDSGFKIVNTLTDPQIPAGFVPYGITDIKGKVYVTYANFAASGGFIDVFSESGNLLRRLVQNSPELNLAWGLAVAPHDFGPLSGALLVGNNVADGRINAFNLNTGEFLGQMKNQSGMPVSIDHLWGLEFGGGSPNNGAVNELFFTAGPHRYADGRFGSIQFKPKH